MALFYMIFNADRESSFVYFIFKKNIVDFCLKKKGKSLPSTLTRLYIFRKVHLIIIMCLMIPLITYSISIYNNSFSL